MTKIRRSKQNKFERKIQDQLKASRTNFSWESEKIPYILSRNYIPDFVIVTGSGKKIYLECKGYFRVEHKAKMAAVKKMWPDLDIRIIFYSNNKANIRWAQKYGFPIAFYEIPDDWLKEM